MTAQEIDHLQKAIRHIKNSVDIDSWAMEIAVDAMEKRIPMKPIRIDKNKEFDGNWKKVCPWCGRILIERITTSEKSYPRLYNYTGYCWCGQAIDWEDER
jgi:hypothetical protein